MLTRLTAPRPIAALLHILFTRIRRLTQQIQPRRAQLNAAWTLPARIRTCGSQDALVLTERGVVWARAEAVIGADVVEAAGGFAAHVEGVVAEAQGAGLVVVIRVGLFDRKIVLILVK